MIKLFFGENPAYQRYRVLAEDFGASDIMFIGLDAAEVFEDGGWQRFEKVTTALTEKNGVRRVIGMSLASDIRGTEDTLDVVSYGERVERGQISPREVAERALADDFLRGALIGKDGRVSAIGVEFEGEDTPIEQLPAYLETIIEIFESNGFAREQVHLAGIVAETVEATKQARFSIEAIFPITTVVLVTIVYLLFGQLWPVFATCGVGLIALIWTFAFAVLLDPQINLMLAMVPAVMMVVSFSDVVHLCSAYALELRSGYTKDEAIAKSATEVGTACWFTSVTTFFGFVALAFVPTPVFRTLGVVLGFGVAVALIVAMTLVPIFFTIMAEPEVHEDEAGNFLKRLVPRLSGWCAELAIARPWSVVAGFVVLLGFAIGGLTQFEIESNLQERLGVNNPIRVAKRFIESHFSGTNAVDVYLSPASEDGGALLNAEFLKHLGELHVELGNRGDVDSVHSVADLLRTLHRELGGVTDGSLPDDDALIAQYLMLFEVSGGDGFEHLFDEERRIIRMSIRLPSDDLVATSRRGDEMGALIQQHLGSGVRVEVTGVSYLLGSWIAFVVQGQARGLIFALVMTTLVMMVCLRLVGAGLVSMVPNALPLIVLGGTLGWTLEHVDSDILMIGMMAIGIAVDDTIHFLTRYRIEAARCEDVCSAIRNTFAFTGRGIWMTTIILTLGMLPFNLSDYLSTRMMGSLLPLIFVLALIADLLLVPAMIRVGWLRFPLGERGASSDLTKKGIDPASSLR
jgi:predicted RND superfamily exporter protein